MAEKRACTILGHSVEVGLFTDAVEDVGSDDFNDNVLILDNVPSHISDGYLMLYIDNITELDSEQNDYNISRSSSEVVITFNAPLDVDKFPAGKYVLCTYL